MSEVRAANAGPATASSLAARSGKARQRLALLAGGLAAIAGLLWATSRPKPRARGALSSVTDIPVQDGDLVRFTKAFAARAGLTSELAIRQMLSPLVRASGAASFDRHAFAAVGVRVSGRISRVFKIAGDNVDPGAVLAELDSPELARSQAQLIAARARERVTAAQAKRAERLAETRGAALHDADEIATTAYETARVERIAAEQAAKALGDDGQKELGILLLRSPIAGRVVTAKVARGQAVQPSDTVYGIADLSSLWVELDVFERDLGSLRVGDQVRIQVGASDSRPLDGKVVHVGDIIDRDARTAPVRVTVQNRTGALRPGQSVTASIETTAPPSNLLTVPLQSVTRVEGQTSVFVVVDDTSNSASRGVDRPRRHQSRGDSGWSA